MFGWHLNQFGGSGEDPFKVSGGDDQVLSTRRAEARIVVLREQLLAVRTVLEFEGFAHPHLLTLRK